MEKAEEFIAAVRELRPEVESCIWDSQDAMREADFKYMNAAGAPLTDYFPFQLQPPIALIQREDSDGDDPYESEVEAIVEQYGGVFAGT